MRRCRTWIRKLIPIEPTIVFDDVSRLSARLSVTSRRTPTTLDMGASVMGSSRAAVSDMHLEYLWAPEQLAWPQA